MPLPEDALGRSIYASFSRAVKTAIRRDNGEYCAIFAPSLAWLLNQEGANYWGTRGITDYNKLIELCLHAIRKAKEKGYPSYLANGVIIAEAIMKDMGYVV